MTPKQARQVLNGDWTNQGAPADDCQICQRFQPLVWHNTEKTILDRAHCRRTKGQGIWVCAMCEEAIHRWIKNHPGENAGTEAVEGLLDRLANRLLGPRRKYRKRRDKENE